jgi:hypothetical protein
MAAVACAPVSSGGRVEMDGNPGSGGARCWRGILSLVEGMSRAGDSLGRTAVAQLLQGWANHISFCADHTYVACPDAGDEFFDCWGEPSRTGPDRVLICEGEGNYPVANCYRCSLDYEGKIYPDTACIGIYALNGVCHQSANCFLFTAGVTLTFEVRGYWFTLLVYGTYGDFFTFWAKLLQCSLAGGVEVPETGARAVEINPSLLNQIRSLYEASAAEVPVPSRNEMLIREGALVTRFYAPDIDPARFRDVHAALLAAKDAAIASGLTRADLAARLNAVAAEYQGILAERLGAAAYQRLMGVPAGQRVDIIEPGLEAVAGVQRPGSAPQGDA